MADVYLVYASEDRAKAERLFDLLSPRWSVWWDDLIVGRFSEAIEAEMPRASCVIPLFSSFSRNKDTVIDELRLAQKHEVEILPIRLDESDPPYGFGGYSYCELHDWIGNEDHPGVQQLLRRLARIIPPKAKPIRPASLASGRLPLPSIFLSVSSHETQLKPADAVNALRVFGAPAILVSAYDTIPRKKPRAMLQALTEYHKQGGYILVDSGNYEASRRSNPRWKHEDLGEALANTPHDCAFCFDVMKPSSDPDKAIEEILTAVERDQSRTAAPILPIVHVPKTRGGEFSHKHIPTIIRKISERLTPFLIGIPERELGPGLMARAQMMRAIRKELDQLPQYQPIHLLGTGNPWSIAVLSAAGADAFDGLEWCRVVVDRNTDRLNHFQHFDFFTYQTQLADSPVAREALSDPAIDFAGKVAFHNLDYFVGFANDLREAVAEGSLEAFIVGVIGKDNAAQLKQQVGGLFN